MSIETQSTIGPSQYCVLRAGQTSPEILHAASDEEAWAIVQRQVRMGQLPFIALYKMIGAEAYSASSERVAPEQVATGALKSRPLMATDLGVPEYSGSPGE